MRRTVATPVIYLVILGGALLPFHRAGGQGAKVSSPVELARAADQLKPGEWVLAPSVGSVNRIV